MLLLNLVDISLVLDMAQRPGRGVIFFWFLVFLLWSGFSVFFFWRYGSEVKVGLGPSTFMVVVREIFLFLCR